VRQAIESLYNTLKARAPGVKALVVFGPHGSRLGWAASDPQFTTEAFAVEFAMFLRIASSTAEDTGIGDIEEHILVTPAALVIMRRLPENQFAVLVSSTDEHLGRLRYELKRSLLYSPFFNYELERT
jgi:predicted regulator of Ras-like GTPase activity (Roadblock/LC7/MglB family)